MENDFFQYFHEETKGFVFSTRQRDIPCSIQGDPHAREVKALITEIRRMAIKKSFQLPESFAADCDREDWIQLSLITMYHCCENYDRKRPFDHYVRFMVSCRLRDKQRSLMRKNPPTDRDILYLHSEMKKIKGNTAAIAKLAEETNHTIEQLQEIVHSGVGQRVFTPETENTLNTAASPASLLPGAQTEAKEIKKILLACIKRLTDKQKALFLRHEMEEISLKNLYNEACCRRSFATFKRWYKAEIFEKVQQCVLSQT